MLRPAEDVCLLIADITGYTGFLTGTELEHAQDVIAAFIENVIGALEPTFQVSGTEGDAVFVVASLDGLDGQLVLDVVDACYFSFRRQARDVTLATTCDCNACRQIPSLDLKFVVHTGQVVRSTVARRETLAGPAAILVHRLLKNSVSERFGRRAYLLITEDAIRTLDLDETDLLCSRSLESYEHLGDVPTVVVDMERRWQAAEGASAGRVDPDAAVLTIERTFAEPPPVIWDYLTEPRRRLLWQAGVTAIDEAPEAGRRDVGMLTHCHHGALDIAQHVIEWRPFERITWDHDVPGMGRFRNSVVLEPQDGGTRVLDLSALIPVSLGGMPKETVDTFGPMAEADYDRLETLLAETRLETPARP